MPDISKEVVSLLYFLMPGFLVAWVVFGLTSHKKPDQFERLIQALIYTVSVNAIVFLGQKLFVILVSFYSLGEWAENLNIGKWSENSNLVASLLTALILGMAITKVINQDLFFPFLRKHNITKRNSQPNEWSDVLHKQPSYVVLHLVGEKRLYGWPDHWPSDPQNGQFFITSPAWLLDSGPMEIAGVEGVLIDVKNIEWVEVMSINKDEINE